MTINEIISDAPNNISDEIGSKFHETFAALNSSPFFTSEINVTHIDKKDLFLMIMEGIELLS